LESVNPIQQPSRKATIMAGLLKETADQTALVAAEGAFVPDSNGSLFREGHSWIEE
jgi:hypothetical protein